MAGMVHGVVVQMTTDAALISANNSSTPSMSSAPSPLFSIAARVESMLRSRNVRTGKAVQMVSLTWSSYSTSASARAVFSTTLHITGFEPR